MPTAELSARYLDSVERPATGLVRHWDSITKGFVGKRPRTWVAMSDAGRAAFTEYLDVLQQIIAQPAEKKLG